MSRLPKIANDSMQLFVDVKISRDVSIREFESDFVNGRKVLRLRYGSGGETFYTVVATFDPVLAHL